MKTIAVLGLFLIISALILGCSKEREMPPPTEDQEKQTPEEGKDASNLNGLFAEKEDVNPPVLPS